MTIKSKLWLILGGSGQLGKSLQIQLLNNHTKFVAPSSKDLDIRDFQETRSYILSLKPVVVINCAGWTDVVRAESFQTEANVLNGRAVHNLISACKEISSTLAHISTDYVFSGSKSSPYLVDDIVDPINAYGKSKVMGERFILESKAEKFYIFRTAWLYSEFGVNFVKKIILKQKSGQSHIKVVNDQFGNPTSASDLASQIIRSVELNIPYGIYHAVNTGMASWYDLAIKTLEFSGKDSSVIQPIDSKEYLSEVHRPIDTSLDTSQWLSLDIPAMRSWEEALSFEVPRIIQSM